MRRTGGALRVKKSRHRFSKVLSIVPIYSECTRTLTFQNFALRVRKSRPRTANKNSQRTARKGCRHRFSKVLSIVPFYSKCTRALTFENACSANSCATKKRCECTSAAATTRHMSLTVPSIAPLYGTYP